MLKKFSLQTIHNYEIIYIPNWNKSNGALRIIIPFSDGNENIAKCMQDFIKLTKNEIENKINIINKNNIT